MNSKRIFFIMIAVIVLLLAAIGAGAYLANQQLEKQAHTLLEKKTQAAVLEKEQVGLIEAKKYIADNEELGDIAKTIVPQDKDQAQAVREIIKIANDSGIKPTSITFPVSTLGSTAPKTAPAGGIATPSTGAASKQSALSQLTPVKGIKGVYNLQITIQQDTTSPVPYDKFIDFLSRLEQNRRTAQVTSILIQPSSANPNLVAFTLTVDEFIKP